ncbi:hypothetical protein [Spiroplasma gladiatoris]|nr:hypothetical protein [Spiroplasma gladiatoris]
MKIWEIFFSKIMAIVLIIFTLSIFSSTIVILENLIIFNDNVQVTKLIFLNLYLIFLVPLFVFGINLLIVCLNLQKISLIASSFFLGLLSLFYLINAVLYDFESYNPDSNGSNIVSENNYNYYLKSFIKNYKQNNKEENKVINGLIEYSDDSENINRLVKFDNLEDLKDNDDSLKSYYNFFAEYNRFSKSGGLFYNIDLFNKFNKQFLIDQSYYKEAKYDNNLIEKNILFKELYNFKDEKTKNDIFEYKNWDNKNFVEVSTYLKELNNYIKKLNNYFKNNENLKTYYNDLVSINKLIIDIYKKGFYLNNENYFLIANVGTLSINKEAMQYFKFPFSEYKNYSEKRELVFNIQEVSSAKLLYQGILFYLVNNWDYKKQFYDDLNNPDDFVLSDLQMTNYYTSPFLWMEFLYKFGLVNKTFDNIMIIESAGFYLGNNLFKIDYSKNNNYYSVNDYLYKGPNTYLLVFLIIFYSSLLIFISFLLYKRNFYK